MDPGVVRTRILKGVPFAWHGDVLVSKQMGRCSVQLQVMNEQTVIIWIETEILTISCAIDTWSNTSGAHLH